MKPIQKIFSVFLGIQLLVFTGCAKDSGTNEQATLEQWNAGAKVSIESVTNFGIERCFAIVEINDDIFSRIYKKSFKESCTTPKSELRYIKVLHYNLNKQICLGEIICNKALANDLIDIFKTLYNAKYPIEKMLLVDDYDANDDLSGADNNSSAFNFRFITGSKKLSNHSTGCAIDINPQYNPYVKMLDGKLNVSPENGVDYVDRTANFPYKLTKEDLCVKEFIKHGFTWGGNWTSLKDYMHFEKSK